MKGFLFVLLLSLCFVARTLSFAPPSSIQTSPLPHVSSSTVRWRDFPLLAHHAEGEDLELDNDDTPGLYHLSSVNRRGFFRKVVLSTTATALSIAGFSSTSSPAQARGLVTFPCTTPLLNEYHLIRAGTNLLEEVDVYTTNPLFLTNREAALSQTGIAQIQMASQQLADANIQPSVIKYSLAASAMDTAGIIRDDLKVGQNRVVPEFTFMDPRAIGQWEGMSYQDTFPAVVAMDEFEAGSDGTGARPPPNIDGTPQDTLADQAIRLRQVMSILETQYSGDSIVLVFPDGSTPALLSTMMAGIPYNQAHVLEFAPGELRVDVTYQSALELYNRKTTDPKAKKQYAALLQKGQEDLKKLRSMESEELVSKKDQIMEAEQAAIEAEYQEMKQAQLAQEEANRQVRLERQRAMDQERWGDGDGETTAAGNNNRDRFNTNDSIPPLAIGGAFASYAVVSLSSVGQETTAKNDLSGKNVTEMAPPVAGNITGLGLEELDRNTDSFADTLQSLQLDRAPSSSSKDEGANGASLYGAPLPSLSPPKTEEGRLVDASHAMKDYLEQDDGGDAWLQAMTDIIDEDDDILIIPMDELMTPEIAQSTTKEDVETSVDNNAKGSSIVNNAGETAP